MIKVGITDVHITKSNFYLYFLDSNAITFTNNLQIVLLDTMVNYVLKHVITVLTILHATPTMDIVNVCLAGLQVTAQSVR